MTILLPDKAEILGLLATPDVFRGYFVPAEALPPPAMLLRALAPEASQWLAPRLFYIEAARQIVGAGAFKTVPQDRRIEIGYGIAPPCRGQGYASAGVRLLLAEALASGAVDHVFAAVSVANYASQRLLAKLGFAPTERTLTDEGLMDIWISPTTPATTPPTYSIPRPFTPKQVTPEPLPSPPPAEPPGARGAALFLERSTPTPPRTALAVANPTARLHSLARGWFP